MFQLEERLFIPVINDVALVRRGRSRRTISSHRQWLITRRCDAPFFILLDLVLPNPALLKEVLRGVYGKAHVAEMAIDAGCRIHGGSPHYVIIHAVGRGGSITLKETKARGTGSRIEILPVGRVGGRFLLYTSLSA